MVSYFKKKSNICIGCITISFFKLLLTLGFSRKNTNEGWGHGVSRGIEERSGSIKSEVRFPRMIKNSCWISRHLGFFFKIYVENEAGRLVPDLFLFLKKA